jgi:hypothetical protein
VNFMKPNWRVSFIAPSELIYTVVVKAETAADARKAARKKAMKGSRSFIAHMA